MTKTTLRFASTDYFSKKKEIIFLQKDLKLTQQKAPRNKAKSGKMWVL